MIQDQVFHRKFSDRRPAGRFGGDHGPAEAALALPSQRFGKRAASFMLLLIAVLVALVLPVRR